MAKLLNKSSAVVSNKSSAVISRATSSFSKVETGEGGFGRVGSGEGEIGRVSSGEGVIRRLASGEGGFGRLASGEGGFSRVTSGGVAGLIRRSIVAKKLIVSQPVVHPLQGREFVRTLARKGRRPDHSLDPNAKYSKDQIESFCKHLIGADQEDLVAACVSAIEKEPHERSLLQLQAMMEFVQTCPSFREITVVERFIMVRSSRLLRYREGHEVYRPGDAHTQMYIILRGKVAVKGEDHERTLGSGQAFGCTDMQRLLTGIGVYPGDGDEMELYTKEAYTVRAEAELLALDCAEYRSVYDQYVQVVQESQNGLWYVASFLASLDVFRNWAWGDVVDLAHEVQGVQVDKGITLFRQGDLVDGIHILHKGECSIESSDAGPDSHRPGESDSPGPGSSAPRNLKPQRQYGVLVNQSSDEHGLPLLSLSKHAPRRSVELASCGPRTVFGEELATGVKTRRFTVRMTASSFFLFIPSSVLANMQGERKKTERRALVDAELVVLSKNRERWLPPRAARLLEADAKKMRRHAAPQRAVSPAKHVEGIAGRT